MPNDADQSAPIAVVFTPEFKRNLRQLAKKYRRIKADVQATLDSLQRGQTPGDHTPGVQYAVFKVRVRNSDSGRGKRGGYRMLYQRQDDGTIVLVTIYSKSEQEDIAPHEIRQIILDYATQRQPTSTEEGPSTITTEPEQTAENGETQQIENDNQS